jgi:hypothetical protein
MKKRFLPQNMGSDCISSKMSKAYTGSAKQPRNFEVAKTYSARFTNTLKRSLGIMIH